MTTKKKGRSHGTPGRYNEGCTCNVCTDANTARHRASRERRADREPQEHGASAYRNWNCTCDVCTEDNRRRLRESHHAAGPGVNRRKEWSPEDLAVATQRQPDGRRYAKTALEAALELGRSVSAVNQQRSLVNQGKVKLVA